MFEHLFKWDMAVGPHQWHHSGGFSVHHPFLIIFRTYFSGDWDVHRGYGVLTHSHVAFGLHASDIEIVAAEATLS